MVGYQTHQYAYPTIQALYCLCFITYRHFCGKQGKISRFYMADICFFMYRLPLLFLTGYTQLRSPFSRTYTELIKDEANRHFLIVLPHTRDSLMALQLIYA